MLREKRNIKIYALYASDSIYGGNGLLVCCTTQLDNDIIDYAIQSVIDGDTHETMRIIAPEEVWGFRSFLVGDKISYILITEQYYPSPDGIYCDYSEDLPLLRRTSTMAQYEIDICGTTHIQ